MRFLCLRSIILVAFGVGLFAQDASLVLRTSVGYNTQKASLPLTDDQKKEADRLGQEAQRAGFAGKYGDAMRLYFQGMAVMNKVEWTPAVEFAASLQPKLDHAMVEPGSRINLSLAPLYPSERARETKLTATVYLLQVNNEPSDAKPLVSKIPVNPVELSTSIGLRIPETPTGNYVLEARLAPTAGDSDPNARASYTKRIQLHVEPLSSQVERLRTRLAEAAATKAPALADGETPLSTCH